MATLVQLVLGMIATLIYGVLTLVFVACYAFASGSSLGVVLVIGASGASYLAQGMDLERKETAFEIFRWAAIVLALGSVAASYLG